MRVSEKEKTRKQFAFAFFSNFPFNVNKKEGRNTSKHSSLHSFKYKYIHRRKFILFYTYTFVYSTISSFLSFAGLSRRDFVLYVYDLKKEKVKTTREKSNDCQNYDILIN